MKIIIMLLLAGLLTEGFLLRTSNWRGFSLHQAGARRGGLQLRMAKEQLPQIKMNENIARLQAMAAKLKAEAAEMEALVAQDRVKSVAEAFDSFDTNRDGSISVEELKEGLEKAFKNLIITEEQAKKLMIAFDNSGDGAIQIEEFQGVEAFKLRLEAFLRDEKEAAIQATASAKEAQVNAELAEQRAEALAQFLNDGPASDSDKIVSLLPYLFPLLDSVQYGRYLLNTEESNPLVRILTIFYNVYENVPFSGLIAFFALSVLSNNMRLNRLVRFNIQQAIFLDIGLIVPGLLGGIGTVGLPYLGVAVPENVSAALSTLTFVLFSSLILYSCASSLLGQTPNKIPYVSERVELRVPTANMFDEEGRLLSPEDREDRDRKNKK